VFLLVKICQIFIDKKTILLAFRFRNTFIFTDSVDRPLFHSFIARGT
jgi:hypothetical protein